MEYVYLVMGRKKAITLFILIIGGLVVMNSCKIFKKTITDKGEDIPLEEVFLKVSGNELPDTFSASRVSISYVGDENQVDLRGNILIKRDSSILVSLSALFGIEVVRALFDEETIQVLDRMNRQYQKSSYNLGQQLLSVDLHFSFLQNLLINGFKIDDLGLSETFSVGVNEESIMLIDSSNELLKGFKEARFTISTNNYRISKIELIDQLRKRYLIVEYSSYIAFGDITVPVEMKMTLRENDKNEILEFRYGRIIVNEPVTIYFSIPDRYTKYE